MHRADAILDFWFGSPEDPDYGEPREKWFRGGQAFDDEIHERFLGLLEEAETGAFDDWRDDPRGCLALILLFDQFSRNMFRTTPRAFATDPQARALARHAVERNFHRGGLAAALQFFYLPFEHSEDLDDQYQALSLVEAMEESDKKEKAIGHVMRHLKAIERFGRFPHRNQILGRESTPEELEFLDESDAHWFGNTRGWNVAGKGKHP